MNNYILVFDLDGTLINSDECIFLTWRELFKQYPPEILFDDEVIKTFSGPPLEESVIRMYPHGDHQLLVNEYKERTKKYYDDYIYLFDDEIKYLKLLKDAGFKFALNTNKIRERSLYTLNKLNLIEYLDYLVCGDDVKKQKPDKEGLDKIINHFNCKKEDIIFIGDTIFDYDTSINGDVKCILLTMLNRKFDENVKPYKFINSFKELYEFLIKLI